MGGQVSRASSSQGRALLHPSPKQNTGPCLPPYVPLRFHPSTKGSQIVMDRSNRSVRRLASFCNAITFTNRPVRIYEPVRLKITQKQGCWSGALRVGFSTVDPSKLGSGRLPRFVCPDLVDQRRFWAQALPEEHCEEGTILSIWMDSVGRVFYQVNEGSARLLFSGVPAGEPLWAIIDIYGLTCGVQMLESKMSPVDYLGLAERYEGVSDFSELDLQEDQTSFSSSPNSFNSALSHQLSEDLHFHSVHGLGLCLQNKHLAVRHYSKRSDGALIFTHRPLHYGESVFLKVSLRSHSVTASNGLLSYGFTSCDPARLNPKHLPVDPEDLLDRKEFWAFSFLSSPHQNGDVFGFRVTAEGEVLVSHNGEQTCREMCVENSTPLWMVFDVPKRVAQISIQGVSCGYSPSSSEIPRPLHTSSSHIPKPERRYKDSSLSLSSSTGTTSSTLSSESPSGPSGFGMSGNQCLVCCDRAVDSVLYTCGHMCVCSVCAERLKEMPNPSCPVCRRPIRDIIKIYRSM